MHFVLIEDGKIVGSSDSIAALDALRKEHPEAALYQHMHL